MSGALHDLATVSRLVLLLVFAFAGVAKLRNLASFRQTLLDFGLPASLTHPLAVALPVIELSIAAALVLSGSVGGVLALLLLLVLSGAIQANLLLGRRPNCHCFGQLGPAPIGVSSIVRNAALAIMAAVVIWEANRPAPSLSASLLGQMAASERVGLAVSVVEVAMLAGVLVLAWQIVKQQGRILIRLDALEARSAGRPGADLLPETSRIGLEEGTPAPDFALDNLLGESVSLSDLIGRARPILLVFSSPHCGPCQHLLPELARWAERLAGRLTLVVVSEGHASEHHQYPVPELVLVQERREIAERFQAWGTPSAVLLHPDGTVGSGVAAGAEQIGALVNRVDRMFGPPGEAGSGTSSSAEPGASAGEIELPDLDGIPRPVLEGINRDTLLLFWNTECGFCQRMEEPLKHWIKMRSPSDPDIIMVANGSVPELRTLERLAPVFLDTGFAFGAAFGARGTPMALLLDGERRAATKLVAGQEAIFALLEG
jgi:thiol-disulfide isomerase/thioredoxin